MNNKSFTKILLKQMFFISLFLSFNALAQSSLETECDDIENKYSGLLSGYDLEETAREGLLVELSTAITKLEQKKDKLQNTEHFLCMFSLYVMAKSYEDAYKSLRKYISLTEPDPMLFYMGSELNYGYGDIKLAKNDIDEAINLDNSLPHLYYLRAKIHFKLKQYEQVIFDIDKEIENRGDSMIMGFDLFVLRGDAEVKLKRFGDAIEAFQKSLEIEGNIFPCRKDGSCYTPQRITTYKKIINAYCQLGNIEKALSIYYKASSYEVWPILPACLKNKNQEL